MGIAISVVVFAVGAVLSFAVDFTYEHGVNWNVVGEILMGVGAFGLLLSLLYWAVGRRSVSRSTTIVDADTPGVTRQESVDSSYRT
jgi:hypothetical protein